MFIFLFPFATCVWHFLKLTPPNALRQLFFILPNACVNPSADQQLFLSHSLLFLINQALYAIPHNTSPSCPALAATNYLILVYRPCSKTLSLHLFLSLMELLVQGRLDSQAFRGLKVSQKELVNQGRVLATQEDGTILHHILKLYEEEMELSLG